MSAWLKYSLCCYWWARTRRARYESASGWHFLPGLMYASIYTAAALLYSTYWGQKQHQFRLSWGFRAWNHLKEGRSRMSWLLDTSWAFIPALFRQERSKNGSFHARFTARRCGAVALRRGTIQAPRFVCGHVCFWVPGKKTSFYTGKSMSPVVHKCAGTALTSLPFRLALAELLFPLDWFLWVFFFSRAVSVLLEKPATVTACRKSTFAALMNK